MTNRRKRWLTSKARKEKRTNKDALARSRHERHRRKRQMAGVAAAHEVARLRGY